MRSASSSSRGRRKPSSARKPKRIKVVSFDGLVIEAARKIGASIMIRGLRDGTDLDYEMQMAGMNETMAPELQTVFLAGQPVGANDYRHTRAPDSIDGWRHPPVRACGGRRGARKFPKFKP